MSLTHEVALLSISPKYAHNAHLLFLKLRFVDDIDRSPLNALTDGKYDQEM